MSTYETSGTARQVIAGRRHAVHGRGLREGSECTENDHQKKRDVWKLQKSGSFINCTNLLLAAGAQVQE
jgi:hypothetical protein